MKLKFDPNQQYQLDAINTVVDIFAGQPKNSDGAARHIDQDGQLSLEATIARGNSLVLDTAQIAENMRAVQQRNDTLPDENDLIDESSVVENLPHGMNFSIEMETGTGKTYVFCGQFTSYISTTGGRSLSSWCRASLSVKEY